MEKIIEQIKSIDGVETVFQDINRKEYLCVEVKPQDVAVKCSNKEQFDFIFGHMGNSALDTGFGNASGYNETFSCVWITDTDKMASAQSIGYAKRENTTVIPFTQYLQDYDLKEEYLHFMVKEAGKRGLTEDVKYTSPNTRAKRVINEPMCIGINANLLCANGDCVTNDGKWATIIKEGELVEGEIYSAIDRNGEKRTMRFHATKAGGNHKLYSQVYFSGTRGVYLFAKNTADFSGKITLTPTTKKQKKKYIKKEQKNGYFHELRNQ